MPDCKFPLCTRIALDHGFCIHHRMYKDEKITADKPARKVMLKKKASKPLKKKSAKQKLTDKALRKLFVEEFVKDPRCKIDSPVCTHQAEGWHHKVKRSPGNVLVRKNLIMSCNNCNTYIESHTSWAEDKGFIKSKFAKA